MYTFSFPPLERRSCRHSKDSEPYENRQVSCIQTLKPSDFHDLNIDPSNCLLCISYNLRSENLVFIQTVYDIFCNVLHFTFLLENELIFLLRIAILLFPGNESFNPLTPMSDQDRISPYNINALSIIQVMRIKKNKI